MIICPWCGTNYRSIHPTCRNCGGSLPLPVEQSPESPATGLAAPPPSPRTVPHNYVWRILFTDGAAIAGGVFLLIGVIFGIVGIGLTVGIVTAFIGLPFAGLGLLFSVGGGAVLIWRYEKARQTIQILRAGEAALGEILEVYQNFHVQVNGRHPWTVVYRYEVDGRMVGGKVTTLSRPDLAQQPWKAVYVLYSPGRPEQSTTYPHPYGYYGI